MSFIQTIQMFGTTSGDSVASIDIPEDGEIVGYDIAHAASGLDADADVSQVQLSFASTNSMSSNDARGVILNSIIQITAATAASIAKTSVNKFVEIEDGIPVNAGERLHMHASLSAGGSYSCNVLLFLKIKGSGRAAVRRR